MGSWSDFGSCRERTKRGAKFDSKNSGHPRAAERTGERLGGLHPSCPGFGEGRGGRTSPAAKVHAARMAERFGGAVKSRDQLVLL